jgi:hypothetical protein
MLTCALSIYVKVFKSKYLHLLLKQIHVQIFLICVFETYSLYIYIYINYIMNLKNVFLLLYCNGVR